MYLYKYGFYNSATKLSKKISVSLSIFNAHKNLHSNFITNCFKKAVFKFEKNGTETVK